LAEGVVDLDRVQPRGVILQEVLRRDLLRVKFGFPSRVGEAGCACEKLGHSA
jgi:hypothetical protein